MVKSYYRNAHPLYIYVDECLGCKDKQCVLRLGTRGNMDYLVHMKKAVDYIEDNLQNNIDLASCAKSCGYSQYHFLRLFKYTTGMTPADYIRKRRISEIAKQIAENMRLSVRMLRGIQPCLFRGHLHSRERGEHQ